MEAHILDVLDVLLHVPKLVVALARDIVMGNVVLHVVIRVVEVAKVAVQVIQEDKHERKKYKNMARWNSQKHNIHCYKRLPISLQILLFSWEKHK